LLIISLVRITQMGVAPTVGVKFTRCGYSPKVSENQNRKLGLFKKKKND